MFGNEVQTRKEERDPHRNIYLKKTNGGGHVEPKINVIKVNF
jgi:hypothetical protein